HHCSSPSDGRHRQRKHREIAPFLWRSSRFLVHFSEKHLRTEQEQNDAAGHFERVYVNTDRVENDLASSHSDHDDDRGVNASTQRVQCRSARLSEAVSPAKSARVAIGLIVVKSVAKSLLILIRSGDIVPTFYFILLTSSFRGCILSLYEVTHQSSEKSSKTDPNVLLP